MVASGGAREAFAMGYARSQLINASEAGTYHCVSRCVRRAFLCGEDAFSGRNFDHRKQWIEDRLLELAEVFAASVLAYAVMSNHVHVVVRVDPALSVAWGDEEIATRWVRLFPATVNGQVDPEGCRRKVQRVLANPDRLVELRQRLGDLSWFMRCLSEPIARRANGEDCCTGRFWEGRFKCQALLDDAAVLGCMTYVDLNPVRAGAAPDLRTSHHTSIQRRLQSRSPDHSSSIEPVAGPAMIGFLPMTEEAYIRLVDWTGRQLHPAKRGVIAAEAPPPLPRGLDEKTWKRQVRGIESRYFRAIGSAESLRDKARAIGQRWLMVRRQEVLPT